MSSSNTLTYDQTPSVRPTVDDLGGGAKVNGLPEPDPVRQLRAEDINQMSLQIAAFARVLPVAILQVDQSGGTYTKVAVTGMRSTNLSLSTFTVTRVSAGVIEVTWTTARFPAPIARPTVQVQGTTALSTAVETYTSGATSGARLRFGSGTDTGFDLHVY